MENKQYISTMGGNGRARDLAKLKGTSVSQERAEMVASLRKRINEIREELRGVVPDCLFDMKVDDVIVIGRHDSKYKLLTQVFQVVRVLNDTFNAKGGGFRWTAGVEYGIVTVKRHFGYFTAIDIKE